jgi:hypothetical protein
MNKETLKVGNEIRAEGYMGIQEVLALKDDFVVFQGTVSKEQGSQTYDKITLAGREFESKDQVVAPQHYADRKYQTILVMEDSMSEEQFKGYLKGNVMKYISRAGKKDKTLQELNKAKTYLQWLIEMEEHGSLQEVPEYK